MGLWKLKKNLYKLALRIHDGVLQKLYRMFLSLLKVDKNIILFECMLGRSYGCNPRAIYEKMLEKGLDKKYRIYWIRARDKHFKVPGGAKIITRNTLAHHYYMAKAGIWVFNTRQNAYFVKRKEQHYIQTWHGTPLKLLGMDMNDVFMAGNQGIEVYKANFWKQSRRWDYLVSPSEYTDDIFRHCFDFKKEYIKTGYPRNDSLVNNNNKEYIDALKDKYKIPKDKKIILYAPTWRDNESIAKGKYIFNPHLNFDRFYNSIKDEYMMIVKYHYLIADRLDFSRFEGGIKAIDADITDLFLISDIHMTDYSSTMFDYAVLDRPMVFYCYDLDNYFVGRGVYFDFEEYAPGPILKDTDELMEFFRNPDFEPYKEKYRIFREKFSHREDGKGAERVVDLIESF